MVVDPIRMCELWVSSDAVNIDGLNLDALLGRLTVMGRLKDRSDVTFVDLPPFGQPSRLWWCKGC